MTGLCFQRFTGPGVLALADELSVKQDDVRDIEDHAADDKELHERHERRLQEVANGNAVCQHTGNGAHGTGCNGSEKLEDGDVHGLSVRAPLSVEHLNIQRRDEDVLQVSRICALMVVQLNRDGVDAEERQEDDQAQVRLEQLFTEARKRLMVFIAAVLELQVHDDAVEEEPHGVHRPLNHGLTGNSIVAVGGQEGRPCESEQEFPGDVQTEDEERHARCLVLEAAVDDIDVRQRPEDARDERQDDIEGTVGNGDLRNGKVRNGTVKDCIHSSLPPSSSLSPA